MLIEQLQAFFATSGIQNQIVMVFEKQFETRPNRVVIINRKDTIHSGRFAGRIIAGQGWLLMLVNA
jgi:hypothetical protein